jgi:ribosomal protein S4E
MRKTVAIMLLAALLLAASGLAGCSLLSNANDEANDLITAANVHLKKYQASDDNVRVLAAQVGTLGITPADATQALTLTAQIKTELQVQKAELQAASAQIAKIKTIDADETFKEYANLMVKALTAQEAVVDEGIKVYAEMDKLYTALRDGNASTTLTSELSANITSISNNIHTLSDASTKAFDAAASYFNKTAP